ncbi:hypothetical protein BV22DRAFT_1114199 [Leucogyrophana mollusca]|uniref:Uncharacterized protein n=1 Tax=Leucogyrophana mollusca TaxID=85980 RepID=A0ACB8BAA9_9AGAM|nr:hypothetical protein BV22DRAFT_1114199 [Leucogyrophana mollusca]
MSLSGLSKGLKTMLSGATSLSFWITFVVWVLSLVTFLLVARAYLGPYILMRFSNHVRVRSISLRSIRGLYIRRGSRTWRVDRIGVSFSSPGDGKAKRLAFNIEGLKLEIDNRETSLPQRPPHTRHRRRLTLADLSPSPLALYLWSILSTVYSAFDPFIRPIIRFCVIRYIPTLTEALQFELSSAVVTFTTSPHTRLFVEDASLHAHLAFTRPRELPRSTEEKSTHSRPSLSPRALAMGAWKSRLGKSFKRTWARTWDNTWGQTKGTASFSFKINRVAGLVDSRSSSTDGTSAESFFSLPGTIAFIGSARFSPKDGTLDVGSLQTGLCVSPIHVDVDGIRAFLDLLKLRHESAAHHEPHVASPLSPKSPSLIEGVYSSTSLRSSFVLPYAGLQKKRKPMTWISSLAKFEIELSALTFTSKVHPDSYKAILRDISCRGGLSNPQSTPLHREWCGSKVFPHDNLLSNVYFSSFSLAEASLQRASVVPHTSLTLFSLASITAEALVSQWPSPWVTGSSSHTMSGDPNAPLLAITIKVARATLTERLDVLAQMLSRAQSHRSSPSPLLPSVLSPIPRLEVSFDVGHIHGCLICADVDGFRESFSLEIDTDGFILSTSSSFRTSSMADMRSNPSHTRSPHLPLDMTLELRGILKPTFMRLCASSPATKSRRFSRIPSDSENGDPVVSVEAIEVKGTLTALGEFNDDEDPIVSLDTESLFLDLHCLSDAVLVELWHPQLVAALGALLSTLRGGSVSQVSHPGAGDRPPTGIAASFSVGRLVVFVTGTDINPNGDHDITRGLAFCTGASAHYCALRPAKGDASKAHRSRAQIRHKLSLHQERIVEASGSAKTSAITGRSCVFGKVMLWKTDLRSAAADSFSMDDPYIIERTDPTLLPHIFLALEKVSVDFKLWITPDTDSSDSINPKVCEVVVDVPDVQIKFALAHIYSSIVAARTLQALLPVANPPSPARSVSSVACQVRGAVKGIQIQWDLLEQKVVTRINHLDFGSGPRRYSVSCNTLLVWVPVPHRPHQKEEGERWEELGRLHRLTIMHSKPPSDPITVEGDSVRLRVPSGYILADLILAVTVTAKCLRHLAHTVADGRYSPASTPEPESAKLVPKLAMSFRYVCIEAADDPFESQLGLIWRTGLEAAKERLHREEAFKAKVATILAAEASHLGADAAQETSDYQFHPYHSISIDEARERLDLVHSLDWAMRIRQKASSQVVEEEAVRQQLHGPFAFKRPSKVPDLVKVARVDRLPPLFRITLHGFHLKLSPPSFPISQLPSFLQDQGQGIPRDTLYSLLIPMHLNFSLTALHASLRNYPLPLLHIPGVASEKSPVLLFDSDLVIAEEMGPPQSVDWIPCSINGLQEGTHVTRPFIIDIPKTIMPVKTYANSDIQVVTSGVTGFAWGVSYSAAVQDVVRVVETLTTEPRDTSPSIGFWDKLRLLLHWKIQVSFTDEVRLYIKGTRDPYTLQNDGAGFALCWQGHPKILIGFDNDDKELVQVLSDTMSIIIPEFEPEINIDKSRKGSGHRTRAPVHSQSRCLKTCAKLSSGVRFGVGVVLERSCGPECASCIGTSFDRLCRFFSFRPHYDVKLMKKVEPPQINSADDSYNGYRSDFIHLSVSLTSALSSINPPSPSSFHLTPKAFANFWSWWGLFDNNLSLPIRQGSYYPPKPPSPKFARHLATIKYRLSVPRLLISHAYIDESRDSWVQGTTPFVGVKAMIDHFQADLHQRDQESVEPGKTPDSIKVVRHKPFYAAEVVMKGLDLRAMLATFSEPLKQAVPVSPPDNTGNYRTRLRPVPSDVSPPWLDLDDFVETDWSSSSMPDIHFVPALSCPQLTYFKKNIRSSNNHAETSKFGAEETHTCLLGQRASVAQVEVHLASQRVAELRAIIARSSYIGMNAEEQTRYPLAKMMALLEDYVTHLQSVDTSPGDPHANDNSNYYMPSDTVSANEWADFENVYQVHAPKVFMSTSIRDIMMQYYNCSRARRGFEYHMATRAVKFIRDQAEAIMALEAPSGTEKSKGPVNTAQAAAVALRKIFSGDSKSLSVDVDDNPSGDGGAVDPLGGWEEGVSLRRSHFCLLLKPQIVLRSEANSEAVSVLAAVQAKLQSFKIMDDSNLEDPVSGTIMTRNYMALNGLQTFCPTEKGCSGDGYVPLEVLIDYRCESNEFDRIVPQTNATFHYDRFNRLRLRNNVTSITRSTQEETGKEKHAHLQNETDLVHVRVPQFTVSASDRHFEAISNIVTNLILFSDAAHKSRLEKLETLLFSYDFTDLTSAAKVVTDLQGRLRNAIEASRDAENYPQSVNVQTTLEILKLKAHIFLLAEELSLIFDAIKLAQNRTDDRTDQKSALLLLASSSDISWRMLDEQRDLLAKLAVRDIDYSWLSRQDSSTVNNLTVGDLRAFDGSPHAVWAEIVSKYEEPSNHPLLKKDLFLVADWTVLAPVGGIAIYEEFLLNFHPIRLQLDAALGRRIMEYVWPARRSRNSTSQDQASHSAEAPSPKSQPSSRSSLDSSRLLRKPRTSLDSNGLAPPLRSLGSSRSFTDLRSAAAESLKASSISRVQSHQRPLVPTSDSAEEQKRSRTLFVDTRDRKDDAAEMKTRSSQKIFILVRISSLHLLLSIMKAESFECRDARICTRDLEYRNQTWSFEELADQFIPSDMTWKGWVKMAFHQPLVPVLPVARELISKTKWIASKSASQLEPRVTSTKALRLKGRKEGHRTLTQSQRSRTASPHRQTLPTLPRGDADAESSELSVMGMTLTDEPEPLDQPEVGGSRRTSGDSVNPRSRSRLLSVFGRGRKGTEPRLYQPESGRQSTDDTVMGFRQREPRVSDDTGQPS